MKFNQLHSEIFVPDGTSVDRALQRTTHLGIGAHQDDLEFMTMHPIFECYQDDRQWFCGVTVTNGSGSSRTGPYARFTDEEMQKVRRKEQNKAAAIGEYTAMISLDYPSSAIKKAGCRDLMEDLTQIVLAASPEVIFTHNLADKHDTHIAVAVAVIQTLRQLPRDRQPKKLYGCEVWRNLDWMPDAEKVLLDISNHENLMMSLMGVFDSQIRGGKRYDLATLGRKRANATYLESHAADRATVLEYAMDLTPLIQDSTLDITGYVDGYIQRFAKDVKERISKFL